MKDKPMTATEVIEREKQMPEKIKRECEPIFNRMHAKLFDPIIDRAYKILKGGV